MGRLRLDGECFAPERHDPHDGWLVPSYDFVRRFVAARWSGGTVEYVNRVQHGVVPEVRWYTDAATRFDRASSMTERIARSATPLSSCT
eukprot:4776177-Pleurochrysis_carterae.AAC.1